MKNYGYGKEVDPKLVNRIVKRAAMFGFKEREMEDVLQQVLPVVLDFQFDPAKSNGCKKSTATIAVIDNRIQKIRRSEARYRARQEKAEARTDLEPDTAMKMKVEVGHALEGLTPEQRQICDALGHGYSIWQIAKQLDCSWHAVERQIAHIRSHFRTLGLDHWFGA